mmetsp:Transcript_12621/g.25266  ORF Transcript_12621/g.25266 Transcript_12621/m.25266 type:complete len:83 (-) Transcript_12621:43-291(-)
MLLLYNFNGLTVIWLERCRRSLIWGSKTFVTKDVHDLSHTIFKSYSLFGQVVFLWYFEESLTVLHLTLRGFLLSIYFLLKQL